MMMMMMITIDVSYLDSPKQWLFITTISHIQREYFDQHVIHEPRSRLTTK
jgi:hypothetical protein